MVNNINTILNNNIMKRLISIALMLIAYTAAYSQELKPIILYPDGVPNSKKAPAGYVEQSVNNVITHVTNPELIPFFPEKGTANGTAIIIVAGGAYNSIYIAKEGYDMAKEFNKIGITAFVLKYRMASDDIMQDKTIGPLQDAQAAILMVRTRAAEWGIDPMKVGIAGFSGGGHLASSAGTHFNTAVIDNKKDISLRPDFMILGYPVITFEDDTHKATRESLLGTNASKAQIDLYSNEKQVTANTPPTFIVLAANDNAVPMQNSLAFYNALLAANVKAEIHIFQSGGHGFGLHGNTKNFWFDACKNWLEVNGFIKSL
jgi:acetyl esterase/lipase